MSVPAPNSTEFVCRLRAACVCLRGGRVLLVEHHPEGVDEPYWVPPGGGVLPGERLLEAAARELREETGYAGEVVGIFGARETSKPAGTVFEVFFRIELPDESPVEPHSPTERVLKGARWLDADELGTRTVYPRAVSEWLADPDAHTVPVERVLMAPVRVPPR